MSDNLLFSKSNAGNNDDVWDDTALIRAYDRAIGKIKHDVNKNLITESESSANEAKKKHHKHHKKSLSKKNYKKLVSEKCETVESDENTQTADYDDDYEYRRDWKVGDACYAVFEDGFMYPAKIIEVNEEEESCTLRYDYYDNEESKYFNELYAYDPTKYEEHYESFQDVNSQDASHVEQEEQPLATVKSERKTPEKKKKEKKEIKSEGGVGGLEFTIPPPPPPPAIDPRMFANLTGFQQQQSSKASQCDDDEAFYAMLMSWYISGYHTGYYLGKVQSNAEQAKTRTKQKKHK